MTFIKKIIKLQVIYMKRVLGIIGLYSSALFLANTVMEGFGESKNISSIITGAVVSTILLWYVAILSFESKSIIKFMEILGREIADSSKILMAIKFISGIVWLVTGLILFVILSMHQMIMFYLLLASFVVTLAMAIIKTIKREQNGKTKNNR